ncbi:MAG TPA: DNA cytosine methyltransferase [Xanthobacteraceae bacterium]|nr:DNA cytosine methyltransferase [Xanthobacteraceae bacterium]
MKGGTLFSGIGAPEYATSRINWRWCAEIDPFACAVYRARFGDVPNLGDVTKVDWDAVEPVDVVVFGSPCQSFSVAGKRLGLADPRGNLALVALRVVSLLRPRWFVFENVPGLLSSDAGRDFGAFLGAVGECGYGWAYRVLDAQFAGVPQRRRRLFVVGCLGDWRGAAAVLFEPASLRGDPAPGREAGEGVAASLTHGAESGVNGGYAGRRREDDTNLIVGSFEQNSMAGRGTLGWSAGDVPLRPVKPQSDHQFIAETVRSHPRPGSNSLGNIASEVAPTNPGAGGRPHSRQLLDPAMAVRRLTPMECERLQGFPDGWTAIEWRGKPAADGPRYRALGNAMCVPVVRWILGRLARQRHEPL